MRNYIKIIGLDYEGPIFINRINIVSIRPLGWAVNGLTVTEIQVSTGIVYQTYKSIGEIMAEMGEGI